MKGRLKKSTFVYFIANDSGLVKIGISERPDRRLASLRTGAGCDLRLLGAIEGSAADERAWHRRFEAKKATLEWFRLDDELQAAIGSACGAEPLFGYHSPAKKTEKATRRRSSDDLESQLAARIYGFFKQLHPVATGRLVAQDTGIATATIQKMLERRSLPSTSNILIFTEVYGPSFLRAIYVGEQESAWVTQAYEDNLQDPEVVRARSEKEWRELHGEASRLMAEIEAHAPQGMRP